MNYRKWRAGDVGAAESGQPHADSGSERAGHLTPVTFASRERETGTKDYAQ